MSATVRISVDSPLGEVTVSQTAGRLCEYGAEIEQRLIVDALKLVIAQASAAYGIEPEQLTAIEGEHE